MPLHNVSPNDLPPLQKGIPISSTAFSYDSHGRQNAATGARNGTTASIFNDADLVASTTTPSPGTIGAAPQTTRSYYNQMLQATNVVQPDGASAFTDYYQLGQQKRQYGARTYPTGYSYDYAGRQQTMTNWSTFATGTGARVTSWNYDSARGWLANKRYPDPVTGLPSNTGPDYTYTAGGRLKTRSWAKSKGSVLSKDLNIHLAIVP